MRVHPRPVVVEKWFMFRLEHCRYSRMERQGTMNYQWIFQTEIGLFGPMCPCRGYATLTRCLSVPCCAWSYLMDPSLTLSDARAI